MAKPYAIHGTVCKCQKNIRGKQSRTNCSKNRNFDEFSPNFLKFHDPKWSLRIMASREANRNNEEISNLLSQLIKSLTNFDVSKVSFLYALFLLSEKLFFH